MKIGLALSGGGALGAAHIGVLEEIDRNGIRLERISGTSAGAIIGLLYAFGGVNSIYRFISELDKQDIINKPRAVIVRPPSVLFSQVEQILRSVVLANSFDELAIPFSCVATDLISGDMVVIGKGDPVEAVMASATLPGLVRTRRIDKHLFVDGGVTRNLPADVVRAQGADFVIGSSLYKVAPLPVEQRRVNLGRMKTLLRTLEILERELSRAQIANCDFCFTPPVEKYKWYELDQMDSILKIGRDHAAARSGALIELIKKWKKDKKQAAVA